MLRRSGGEILFVNVAEGHNVFTTHRREVGPAATATADDGDVQFFVRRSGAEKRRRTECECGGGLEEATAGLHRVMVFHFGEEGLGKVEFRKRKVFASPA